MDCLNHLSHVKPCIPATIGMLPRGHALKPDKREKERERERKRQRVGGRERERERESAKFNDTIHTPGDTRDQSLSPVTPKQTFLCDVKPRSSLEPTPFGIVAFSNAS